MAVHVCAICCTYAQSCALMRNPVALMRNPVHVCAVTWVMAGLYAIFLFAATIIGLLYHGTHAHGIYSAKLRLLNHLCGR